MNAARYRIHRQLLLLALVLLVVLGAAPVGSPAAAEPALPPRNTVVPLAQIETICRHYGLTELWTLIESQPPALPFRSDGCSMWPDTWRAGKDLYEGCFIHDLHYWAGLPGDDMGRLRADIWLMVWVAENVSVKLAETMFNGVRVGGGEQLNTPWRWGFGRPAEVKQE